MALSEWCYLHLVARTDHNGLNLKYLCTQKNLQDHQWHWLAFLSKYQFDLIYQPGKQMVVPDALRQKPKTETDFENLLRMQKHPDD
eukprot:1136670-Rhodomonas_salina.3